MAAVTYTTVAATFAVSALPSYATLVLSPTSTRAYLAPVSGARHQPAPEHLPDLRSVIFTTSTVRKRPVTALSPTPGQLASAKPPSSPSTPSRAKPFSPDSYVVKMTAEQVPLWGGLVVSTPGRASSEHTGGLAATTPASFSPPHEPPLPPRLSFTFAPVRAIITRMGFCPVLYQFVSLVWT